MIQMPSLDGPRLCLIPRGWKAIVSLKASANGVSLEHARASSRPMFSVVFVRNASVAPMTSITPLGGPTCSPSVRMMCLLSSDLA